MDSGNAVGSQQKFQRIIQSAGIRTIWLNHRKKRGQNHSQSRRSASPPLGLASVSIAPERIDLSIVGDQPHRCARSQLGKVLVENRACTIAR